MVLGGLEGFLRRAGSPLSAATAAVCLGSSFTHDVDLAARCDAAAAGRRLICRGRTDGRPQPAGRRV